MLARLLQMNGFAVTQAATGDEARLAALIQRFDLLITEIWTPRREEFWLNQLLSDLHGTRGIVLTAHYTKDVAGWRQAEFVALMRKPVDFECLSGRVHRLSDQSPAQCRFRATLMEDPKDSRRYLRTQAAGLSTMTGRN